jgi:hypothetical protein
LTAAGLRLADEEWHPGRIEMHRDEFRLVSLRRMVAL